MRCSCSSQGCIISLYGGVTVARGRCEAAGCEVRLDQRLAIDETVILLTSPLHHY